MSKAPRPKTDLDEIHDTVDNLTLGVDLLVLFFFGLYIAARPMISPPQAAGLGPHTLLQVFVAAAFLLWVLKVNLQGGWIAVTSGVELAMLAFLAWCAVSAANAVEPYESWQQVGQWAADGMAFWLALQYGRSAQGARWLLRALLSTGLVVALYGLYQYAWGFDIMRTSPEALQWIQSLPEEQREAARARLNSNRIFAMFVLPNSLAGYLVLLIPLTLVLAARARHLVLKAAGALFALTMVAALVLSGSKGGMLAFAAALACGVVYAWPALRARPRLLAALVGATALTGAVYGLTFYQVGPFAGVRQKLGDVFPTVDKLRHTAGVRLGYWDGALRIAQEFPVLGAGPDQFQSHYFRVRAEWATEARHTHNDYLQLLAETGLIGLLLYLGILAAGARCLIRGKPPEGAENEETREEAKVRAVDPNTLTILDYGPLCYIVVGIGAFTFLYYMGVTFDAPPSPQASGPSMPGAPAPPDYELMFYVGAALVWITTALAIHPDAGRPTLWALAVGLTAYVLHGLVDFDLYVAQLTSTAAIVGGVACALAARQRREERLAVPFPMWGQLVAGLIMLAPFYMLTNWWLGRTIQYDRHMRLAQQRLAEGTEGLALPEMQVAHEKLPLERDALERMADIEQRNFLRLSELRQYNRRPQEFELALRRWHRSIELNPARARPYHQIARWHEHMAQLLGGGVSRFPAGNPKRAKAIEQRELAWKHARKNYDAAIERYPTNPRYHYDLSTFIGIQRQHLRRLDPQRAQALAEDERKHLAEALRLHRARPANDSAALAPADAESGRRRLNELIQTAPGKDK